MTILDHPPPILVLVVVIGGTSSNPAKTARINLCREGGEPGSRGHLSTPVVRRLYRMKARRALWGQRREATIEAVSIAQGCRTQRPNNVKLIMSDQG